MNASDGERLRAHIAQLEFELSTAKALLQRAEAHQVLDQHEPKDSSTSTKPSLSRAASYASVPAALPINPSLHHLMLLCDSALPLGSFAYSSGLESYLAHHKPLPPKATPQSLFDTFLKLSIQSVSSTTLPYVLAAFRDPFSLMDLDNDLDASTPCTVSRRASTSQGRALLSIWERSFTSPSPSPSHHLADNLEAATCIDTFATDLKLASLNQSHSSDAITVNGHLAPLWGVLCLALGLNLEETSYVFLLNHAKAVLSAAVRASVMGPYMANAILASDALQALIKGCLEAVWFLQPEDAGQVVPVLDLWIGRHEMLYSRIFNS
jgi:urease accessory protein